MPTFGFNINLKNSPAEILALGDKCLATGQFGAIEVTYYENMQDTDTAAYNNAIRGIVNKYNPQVLVHISGFNLSEENATIRRAILSEIENCIRYTKALGGHEIVIHSGYVGIGLHVPLKSTSGGETARSDAYNRSWELSVHMMQDACDLAAKEGFTLYTENLSKESLTNNGRDLVRYLSDVNKPNLKIVFDVGHCNHTGNSIPNDIRETASSLAHLHIHDNHGAKDEHLPPGEGLIDFQQFADSLAKANYSGRYLFELAKCTPENLAASRAIMAKCLGL